ncbi:MAG: sigma 54-interacting transcriptional regulator [Deltaproteobacteria bacterium]
MADPWVITTEPLRETQRDRVRLRQFRITVEDGPDRGESLVSTRERLTVGTHEISDLRLTDRAVSRFHLELELGEHAVIVRDLRSRNGTSVDDVPVLEAPLRDGAVLTVGTTRLRFQHEAGHAEIPLAPAQRFGRFVGGSAAIRAVIAELARVAPSDTTVLLAGETGTGKELAAESLHAASPRAGAPLLVVDCGALPPELLDAELFGHARGAFTGAEHDRAGIFEAAAGGTVLLDEVGELPLVLQPKLLRVLEAREVRRIGETSYRPVNVRVVAATHRDLRGAVNEARFRADLYYRLAVVEIRLPALRERRDDLALLVDTILEQLHATDHPLVATLRTPTFYEALAAHAWPGNVRELRNYLERCLALHAPLPPAAHAPPVDPHVANEPLEQARERWVKVFEHAYLTDLLGKHDGNVTAAARAAGVDRAHLYRLLWRNGLK